MKKVMIVDDSLFIYEQMKRFLADTDFEIAGYAKSGEEAVELYEEVRPDVVTMDIILPGIDGVEVSRRILEKWPEARILMVSSLAYDEIVEQAASLGITKFIYKPFTKEILNTSLEMCMK